MLVPMNTASCAKTRCHRQGPPERERGSEHTIAKLILCPSLSPVRVRDQALLQFPPTRALVRLTISTPVGVILAGLLGGGFWRWASLPESRRQGVRQPWSVVLLRAEVGGGGALAFASRVGGHRVRRRTSRSGGRSELASPEVVALDVEFIVIANLVPSDRLGTVAGECRRDCCHGWSSL